MIDEYRKFKKKIVEAFFKEKVTNLKTVKVKRYI